MISSKTRAAELQAQLRTWRGRLTPQDIGLPATSRRRVTGLRREEVAELAGVSPNWYALFEAGSTDRHFSAAFVGRVAEALRLDERERATLYRLALPEIRLAVEQFERTTNDGSLHKLRTIRTLLRRVTGASSFAEAASAAVENVLEALDPTSVAVAVLASADDAQRLLPAGPRAGVEVVQSTVADTCLVANYPNRFGFTTFSENRLGYRDTTKGTFEFGQRTSDGDSFVVNVNGAAALARVALETSGLLTADVAQPPSVLADATLCSDEYWSWNSKLEVRATITHGLFTNGCYRGNLCALWTAPRTVDSSEVELVRTASAIVELAASGSPNLTR